MVKLRGEARDLLLALEAATAIDGLKRKLRLIRAVVVDPPLLELLTFLDDALRLRPPGASAATAAGWKGATAVWAAKMVDGRADDDTALSQTFIELWLNYNRSRRTGEATALEAIGDVSYLRQRRRRGGAARRDDAERVPMFILEQLERTRRRQDR